MTAAKAHPRDRFRCGSVVAGWLFTWLVLVGQPLRGQPPARTDIVREVQQRVVKIYGAGGLRGLEAYQSGCLVSPSGHIATAWSYVLDVDDPIVVLDDGRRFEAEIVGFEPRLEFAVLKIEADQLPYFSMKAETAADPGSPVLAVSNLFSIAAGNEPASVMQGYIAGRTDLEARSGAFETAYSGPVYVLDLVANNPGAAGGALVDVRGNLLGMLGKELRDERTGVWLNYALPSEVLREVVGDIIAGRQPKGPPTDPTLPREQAHSLSALGLVMIPNILEKTPAYIDRVVPRSAAARAELQADDLILLVQGRRIEGQSSLIELLRSIDKRDPLNVTVQRGSRVVNVTLEN